MSRSYAKVAASRTGGPARPARHEKATKFIYAEHLPTTTIITKKIFKKTLFLKDNFETVESAQKNFNLGDQGPLESLDTSGEITDYVVNSVDGATVEYGHKNDVQTVFVIFTLSIYYLTPNKRYIDLKTEHKGLRQQIKELQQQIKDSEAVLNQWQVVTTLMEGTFIIVIFVYYTN